MNTRIVLGILLALALIAGAIGIGVVAYNAGAARALADGSFAGHGRDMPFMRHMPFGFGLGFGFLGLLVPLFWLLVIFWLVRALFFGWRKPWGWGARHWDDTGGVPPMFEEWHRRAHNPQGAPPSDPHAAN